MDRLKTLRKEKGVTQKEVGEYLGISYQAYSHYENGLRNPDNETLKKLATYFGVSVDYLLGRDERPLPDNLFPLDSESVSLRILGNVRAGTGGVCREELLGYQVLPKELLRGRDPKELFCLHVKGDSMSPRIPEGTLIVVQRQSSVDSGSLAVVSIDSEEAVVKKVYYGSDWIELLSFNPDYAPRKFSGADVQRVFVIGKVIKSIMDWED